VEIGFWESFGYLLLLPVLLVVMMFALDWFWHPWLLRHFREKWGLRGILWFIVISVAATVIWWGVIFPLTP
jgi:hypothetical protein